MKPHGRLIQSHLIKRKSKPGKSGVSRSTKVQQVLRASGIKQTHLETQKAGVLAKKTTNHLEQTES